MKAAFPAPDILLLNANTDDTMTARMVRQARRLNPGCRGETVATGASYISDAASLQVAAQSVERFVAGLTANQHPDAMIVACFGDPAVSALKTRLPFPVVGLADASCEVACQIGNRFAIVTAGRKWPPILHELVSGIGLASRLSGIYALDQTGDRIASDRCNARAALQSQIANARSGGAEVVILGGAGLIGFAKELQPAAGVPLLDSVDCAVQIAMGLAARSDSE